ncbi:12951_t:CDS:2 [Acaulospora colombiana]|uniref:12951_t:CDS:1 n=1 Tax=Acaulospora colombiana TaxID=27376 RepID=A0ACA9KIS0_9GLOM|nr:12951_t:CDS:2 [Acaulospora colombiana]
MLNSVDLSGAKSIDGKFPLAKKIPHCLKNFHYIRHVKNYKIEILQRIRNYISTHRSKKEWITGWGWDQTQWQSKSFPTSKDIDSDPELARYPIVLLRVDGHALWVNERVLNILQKDRIPDKVDGGEIGREKETNRLTGIFVDNAMELVLERIEGMGEGRLTVRSVKLFMDGALGSWGAALLEPYSDEPTKQGLLISDPTLLPPVINQWIEKGFQVNTHCIGDRANRIIIDMYEKCFQDYVKLHSNNGNITDEEFPKEVEKLAEKLRFRIEHAQILVSKNAHNKSVSKLR